MQITHLAAHWRGSTLATSTAAQQLPVIIIEPLHTS